MTLQSLLSLPVHVWDVWSLLKKYPTKPRGPKTLGWIIALDVCTFSLMFSSITITLIVAWVGYAIYNALNTFMVLAA
jgi:hypothetical protein